MSNPQNISPPPARRKRPWWRYLFITLGVLALLLVLLVVGGYFAARAAVNAYTSPQPKPLAKLEYDPATQQEFQQGLADRWNTFSKAVMNRQRPGPFRISVDEINRFLAQRRDFRDSARLVVRNNRLQADFSVPLAQTGRKELAGRYLNGTANLDITFQDGWLNLGIGKVEVNGHPAPDWVVQRLAGSDFKKATREMDNNRDFVTLMQEIESIEIKDGDIVITPGK